MVGVIRILIMYVYDTLCMIFEVDVDICGGVMDEGKLIMVYPGGNDG